MLNLFGRSGACYRRLGGAESFIPESMPADPARSTSTFNDYSPPQPSSSHQSLMQVPVTSTSTSIGEARLKTHILSHDLKAQRNKQIEVDR
jgi:hypothetical protein